MVNLQVNNKVLFFFGALFVYGLFFYFFLKDNPCLFLYDAGHYQEGALGFLQYKAYVGYDGLPIFYRLPGYSFIISLFYFLFNSNVYSLLLGQILLAAFLPLCVYNLAQVLTSSKKLATISALLAIGSPAFMIFSGLLMTEIFSVLIFTLFLFFFLRAFPKSYDFLGLFLSALLLGILSLFRPIGHLLIPFLLLFIYFYSQGSCKLKITRVGVFLITWFLVIVGWLIRNYLLTGYIFFHTLPGPHFVNHVGVRLVAQSEGISFSAAKSKVYSFLDQEIAAQKKLFNRELNDVERMQIQEKYVFLLIKKYPFIFFRLALINCLKTVFSLYSSELLVIDAQGKLPSYDRHDCIGIIKRYLVPCVDNKLIIGFIYYEIVLLFLSIVGFFLALLKVRRFFLKAKFLLVLGLAIFFIGISCACGYARLRIVLEPFYLLAAAYALCLFFAECKKLYRA